MKNVSKKIRAIIWVAVVGILLTGLASCGEKETGGTIVVYNDDVTYMSTGDYVERNHNVYIADTVYGTATVPVEIRYGSSHEFAVKDDGSYWVYMDTRSTNNYPYKEVSVSGGETVKVKITYGGLSGY
jgi:hypothetical protein